MSEWIGFSDADLQRMKQGMENGGSNPGGAKILKPLTGGRPKGGVNMGQKVQRKQNPRNAARAPRAQGDVPPGAMLSKPPPKKADVRKKVASPPQTPTDQIPLHGKTSPLLSAHENEPDTDQAQNEPSKEPELLEDTEVIKEKEKIKLEDVQKRQKEMEEKNKRKKTILTKAIAERKKKAFAESTKLVKIQAELAKLDDMLNYDVSILRDKIDEACWEYSNAQKRFEKAEVEYIDAKMKLHKATEVKDDLTEHLYGLIQLNEERKAKKLEELMQKLELEETSDIELAESSQPSNTESLKPDAESKSEEHQALIQENTSKESPDTRDNEACKIEPDTAATEEVKS